MADLVSRARALADDLLFPAAAEVDRLGVVPRSHFDALAEEGFYGLAAPDSGVDLDQLVGVLEALAGGCLSTAFTWLQHHGLVAGLAVTDREDLRERYLPDLISGRLRAGVARAGVIPTPPRVRVQRVDGGYRFDGEAPFVSGWDAIDLLHLSGRDGDTVVNALVSPIVGHSLVAEPLTLMAAQGTATVRLKLDNHFIPDESVFSQVSYDKFVADSIFASRLNGCAPLGLAERCASLIEAAGEEETATALRSEQDEIRRRLNAGLADPATLPAARAAGADLAYRSAGALAAATGSRAVLPGAHAGRLVREATFLLVAASRPEIRAGLLELARR
ncbi:acyl-CoA dehydrogenase family protein [Amycolatopsis halotolerans]|uniref:Acyl-CoA dehydrogenase family protein n=1 Tax=Amycolatopsis halotolerans TaxID=330083 RepID=A0ABV7QJL9_9PSEU